MQLIEGLDHKTILVQVIVLCLSIAFISNKVTKNGITKSPDY